MDLSVDNGILDLRDSLVLNVDWETLEAGEALVGDSINGQFPCTPSEDPYRFGVIALDQNNVLIEVTADMDGQTLVAEVYEGPRVKSPLVLFQWNRWSLKEAHKLVGSSSIHITADAGKTILCGTSRPLEGGGVEYSVGGGMGRSCGRCQELAKEFKAKLIADTEIQGEF